MRLRGTALFIEGVERGLATAITPIVVPKDLSSGSPEDRELSLSACAWPSAKRHDPRPAVSPRSSPPMRKTTQCDAAFTPSPVYLSLATAESNVSVSIGSMLTPITEMVNSIIYDPIIRRTASAALVHPPASPAAQSPPAPHPRLHPAAVALRCARNPRNFASNCASLSGFSGDPMGSVA